jgi:hypothetical protein
MPMPETGHPLPRKKGINWKGVGVVLPIVFAVIGGGWAAYQALFPPKKIISEVTHHVCTVPKASCPLGSIPIYPQEVRTWAAKTCAEFAIQEPHLPPGTQGRVLTTDVKCTVEKQW